MIITCVQFLLSSFIVLVLLIPLNETVVLQISKAKCNPIRRIIPDSSSTSTVIYVSLQYCSEDEILCMYYRFDDLFCVHTLLLKLREIQQNVCLSDLSSRIFSFEINLCFHFTSQLYDTVVCPPRDLPCVF